MLKLLAVTAATTALVGAPIVAFGSDAPDPVPAATTPTTPTSTPPSPGSSAQSSAPSSAQAVEPSVAPPVDLRPTIDVAGASPSDATALDEALARFRDQGLLLPDLEVRFSTDEADCHGHPGVFESGTSPWRISICSDLAFVLTHELAHAWTEANLDDGDRDAYVVARGLPAWRGDDLEWGERGVEDAAFMIQQNLMAGSVRADSPAWIERMEAYEQLTGQASPLRAGVRP